MIVKQDHEQVRFTMIPIKVYCIDTDKHMYHTTSMKNKTQDYQPNQLPMDCQSKYVVQIKTHLCIILKVSRTKLKTIDRISYQWNVNSFYEDFFFFPVALIAPHVVGAFPCRLQNSQYDRTRWNCFFRSLKLSSLTRDAPEAPPQPLLDIFCETVYRL